jgi:hypothetical protein
MNNKIQNIVLGVLAVGLIGITVAYASLSQNLTINGTAKVAAATWDVHFEGMNAGTATGYATLPTTGKLAASGTSVSGNIGTLKAPGDTITYTFNVKNAGSINAKISSITAPKLTCAPVASGGSQAVANNVCANLTYTIEYTSESPKTIAVGNTLTSGASKNITLKIVNSSNATLASEDIAVTASPMIINYVQY